MRIRNPFQFQSIHTNFALAFSCLILCTTMILSYNTYRLSADSVTANSMENTTQLIEQVKNNIQTYIGNMESISELALSNGDLKRYVTLLEKPDTDEGSHLAVLVSDFFHSIVNSRNDIASIMFVGANGAVVSDRLDVKFKPQAELTQQDWYLKALNTPYQDVISSSHVQHIFRNEYRWVVSISRQMIEGQKGPSGGILLVDLNYNVINDLCKQIQLGKRGYVFIVDPSGNLVYHPQQQLLYGQLKSEQLSTILRSQDSTILAGYAEDRKLYTIRTTEFGWKIVGVTYPDELVGNKRKIQFSSALWGGVSLLFAIAISIYLSLTLTKPIKKLDAHMKKVEKGDFDIRVDIESTNEIGKLARTFNLMIGKIRDLMSQTVVDQEVKRISELKALQAQIQPHFLYNTLDSIIWMGEMGKMEEVVKMTSALAKILRSSISQGEELIPIAVELEHIRNYLTIQSIRYRNKFTYVMNIESDILDCKILRIVLQPLVENAIYHGIKHKADAGHIEISGHLADGVVLLKVTDDGLGMGPEKLISLLTRGHFTEGSKGMGLTNVNQRLQLYFGNEYGLKLESELDEGTTAMIRIPELR